MILPHRLNFCCLLLLICLTGSLYGCGSDESIRQYTVSKSTASELPKPTKVPAGPLLGGTNAWFFKLMGPSDAVLKEALPFTTIVRSLRFGEDGAPQYHVPEKWTASNGPPPRYQTLKVPETTPPLEVTISTLPVNGDDVSKYLLANINRWREQLGLETMEGETWMEAARARGELIISPASSRLVAMINLNGETKESGPTRMLAAIIIDGQPGKTEPLTPPPVKSPVTFKTPEGWTETPGNAMRLASLEAKPDAGTVDISVSRFPGGGDVLANVNRWRQQVKLDPLTEETLKAETSQVDINGRDGTYVEAIGPEQAILAAILPEGEAKWFFKAQGPVAAIEAERARFKEFLASVKLQQPPE